MRKFKLQLGENAWKTYDLNGGASGIFFSDPSGLGFVNGNTFYNINREGGFFRRNYTEAQQPTIAGTINFVGSAYAAYNAFMADVFAVDDLFLIYQPYAAAPEYMCRVSISSFSKGEGVSDRLLSVPVMFTAHGPWYIKTTATSAGGTLVAVHSGQMPLAVVITETGTALENPVITLTADGVEIVRVNITGELLATDKLIYSNVYDDCYIIKEDAGGIVTDLIQNVDLQYTLYDHAAGDITVNVTDEYEATPAFTADVFNYWRTV